jgi:hypothetical protein
VVVLPPEKPKQPEVIVAPEKPVVPEAPVEFTYNPKAPINISITDAQAHFSRYFIYDQGEYSVAEDKFSEFISGVENIINLRGTATILVESSASNVPSSRFKTNQDLTSHRNKVARDQVIQELTRRGFAQGKQYSFSTPKELVQGKVYENDAKKNVRIYEQWQYIKIWAE